MGVNGIFLDDERLPTDVTWVEYPNNILWLVKNRATDFMSCISQTAREDFKNLVISFDHDIQSYTPEGTEETGYDCLKYLVNYLIELGVDKDGLPSVYFHTMNPIGKKNMESYWNNFVKYLEEN